MKHLFFYFFESRDNPDVDDVILWTNGGTPLKIYITVGPTFNCYCVGPGASSALGLFMELGVTLFILRSDRILLTHVN